MKISEHPQYAPLPPVNMCIKISEHPHYAMCLPAEHWVYEDVVVVFIKIDMNNTSIQNISNQQQYESLYNDEK